MKQTKALRSLTALLLAAVLLVSSMTSALARETNFFDSFPKELDFSTLKPAEPDSESYAILAKEVLVACKKADNGVQTEKLLQALYDAFSEFNTLYAVFFYHYNSNPAGLSAQNNRWDIAMVEVYSLTSEIMAAVSATAYWPQAQTVWGSLAEDFAHATPDTPEQQALLVKALALADDYWRVLYTDYPVSHGGKTFANEDALAEALAQGTLTVDTYLSLSLEMAKQKNADMGPIFLQQILYNNQYAHSKGYDNYADYAYEVVFARDYTPEQAQSLHQLVKSEIVPLIDRYNAIYYAPNMEDGLRTLSSSFSNLTQTQILDMVKPHMANISSEYAELFAYMVRCNLVDIAPSATKTSTGYSQELPQYNSAYIFNAPVGDFLGCFTLIHEFGHFAHASFLREPMVLYSYDVAEIHSQGLETLFVPYLDEMIGDANAAAAQRLNSAYNWLQSAVISGCQYDEFLQAVYTEPDLTLDKINRLYHDIGTSYGVTFADDTYAYGWYEVPHSFTQPFYYISYATSMLAALELFSLSQTDYEAACDAYLTVVAHGEDSLLDVLEAAGLSNIFLPQSVQRTARTMEDYLYGDISGVSFADLQGSWAAHDALFCASLGLFDGDDQGLFLPRQTLTRAQAVTILWRYFDMPEVETTAVFSDVPTDAWYASAVSWAAENALITGTNGKFTPNGPITRQELAVLLYRAEGEPESVGKIAAPDAHQIGAWARDAVTWAVENGLLQGYPDGRLAPTVPITRAESATILTQYILH